VHVDSSDPTKTVSGEYTQPGNKRLGFTEERRRQIFQQLVRGEPDERQLAERESETAIWDRNHDSFFHQKEWRRLPGVAAANGITVWMAYLILDEGFKNHWPPPPGVVVLADDAPLAQRTRPLAARTVIVRGPSK